MKTEIRDMTQIALFIVLMIVGGKIAIQVGEIPYTMQTTFCLLAGIILGPRKGSMSLLIYLLIGLAGLPVFARGGGPAYIFMPSFGYLVGMPLAALIAGSLTSRLDPDRKGLQVWKSMPVNLIGMLVIHIFGVSYFLLIKNLYVHQSTTIFNAMLVATVPYLLSDALQCFLAATAGQVLRRVTKPFFRELPDHCTSAEEHLNSP
jgi:biotin transport system substrate-specific component